MNKLQEIIHFIISAYPENKRQDLSNARLTKLVFLSDWRNVLLTPDAKSISGIKWFFHNYGPYVQEVCDAASEEFFTKTPHGTALYISIKNTNYDYKHLTESEKNVICKVIELTKDFSFNKFIDFVYSTYPIKTSRRYTYIDLQEKKNERANLLAAKSQTAQ